MFLHIKSDILLTRLNIHMELYFPNSQSNLHAFLNHISWSHSQTQHILTSTARLRLTHITYATLNESGNL